jgi:hypothetical protein
LIAVGNGHGAHHFPFALRWSHASSVQCLVDKRYPLQGLVKKEQVQ